MRSDYRYGFADRLPASWLTVIGLLLSLGGALLLLAAPLGYRWGLIPLRTALLGMLSWAAYAGIVGWLLSILALALTSLQRRRGLGMALAGVVLGLIAAGVPYLQQRSARGFPQIHDITTDMQDPPGFVDVLPLRADAPNSVDYGGEKIAAQQRQGYPDLATLRLPAPPAEVFDRSVNVVRSLGWDLVAANPQQGRVEATDTTFWFGFKDDVVVRIRPDGGGSRVDVRSVSRVGVGDVGANAARIEAFLSELQNP